MPECCPEGAPCPGSTFVALIDYILLCAPSCLTLLVATVLLPAGRHVELRLALFLAAFILLRDAMSPAKLWSIEFGTAASMTLKLPHSSAVLLVLAVLSASLVPLMIKAEPSFRRYIFTKDALLGQWHSAFRSLVSGLIGALCIAAPMWALKTRHTEGTCLDATVLPALSAFAFLGNFYEEALFRGFLYGHLVSEGTAPFDAAALSALAFAAGHVFLATTASQTGPLLLIFTLYEGSVAAGLRVKGGLLAATMAHGGGIFLIALASSTGVRF